MYHAGIKLHHHHHSNENFQLNCNTVWSKYSVLKTNCYVYSNALKTCMYDSEKDERFCKRKIKSLFWLNTFAVNIRKNGSETQSQSDFQKWHTLLTGARNFIYFKIRQTQKLETSSESLYSRNKFSVNNNPRNVPNNKAFIDWSW